jgi:hypothetical protein
MPVVVGDARIRLIALGAASDICVMIGWSIRSSE